MAAAVAALAIADAVAFAAAVVAVPAAVDAAVATAVAAPVAAAYSGSVVSWVCWSLSPCNRRVVQGTPATRSAGNFTAPTPILQRVARLTDSGSVINWVLRHLIVLERKPPQCNDSPEGLSQDSAWSTGCSPVQTLQCNECPKDSGNMLSWLVCHLSVPEL